MTEEAAERRTMSIDVLKAGGFYQQNYIPQSIYKKREKEESFPLTLMSQMRVRLHILILQRVELLSTMGYNLCVI